MLPTSFSLKAKPIVNPAQQGDTVFLPFESPPEWPEELLSYAKAEELARAIDLTKPNARVFAFVNGSFIFGDFLEALIVAKNYHVKQLLVTALSIKAENVDSLRNLVEGGYVDKLAILVSDFNFSHNRWGLMPYVVEQLGHEGRAQDGRFEFAAVRSHCKICLLETHCGKHLVLHGSANLVSSGNVEQFVVEDNPSLYAFTYGYLRKLLDKYSVLNKSQPDIRRQKPLTKAQTWQAAPPSTPTSTSSAQVAAAMAQPPAAAAPCATAEARAASMRAATLPPATKPHFKQ